MTSATKIIPSLWYIKDADAAVALYISVFPDSRIVRKSTLPIDSPSGPAGTVPIIEFELFGQPFKAISAGKLDDFNHAISFTVECESQAEIDRYWNALTANGGKAEPCGWVRDRFGVEWQIVPARLADMTAAGGDRARRAAEAFSKMKKLDLATIERAFAGA